MDLTKLANDVLVALAKYEYDLAFTAPELWGLRMGRLRSQIASLFEQAVEEQEREVGEEVSGPAVEDVA